MNVLVISEYISSDIVQAVQEKKELHADIACIKWKDTRIEMPLYEFNVIVIDLSFEGQKSNLASIKDLYLDLDSKLDQSLLSEKGLACDIKHITHS